MIAATERDVQGTRNNPIIGEGAQAGQQAPILYAFDAGSDVLRPYPTPEICVFKPESVLAALSHWNQRLRQIVRASADAKRDE